jgi:DNA-binding transcriptional LysR family regulator
MTELIDIKAFLATARAGSFSAAGREIGLATSIITKRVNRLEYRIGTPLFTRSTRRLTLTTAGEQLRPRLQLLIGEIEDTLEGVHPRERGVLGELRIKAPTTVGTRYIGPSIASFQARNPNVRTELLLVDRMVNPLEENFDIALGAMPAAYPNVLDIPLCRYDRVLVASPAYLAKSGPLRHPTDIAQHECLAFLPVGLSWSFESRKGVIDVAVHASFSVNDSGVLLAAAENGTGLAVVPRFVARESLAEGRLVELLPETPPITLWLKALVPRNRVHKPEVMKLLDHLKAEYSPVPPWDNERIEEPSRLAAVSSSSSAGRGKFAERSAAGT